MVRDLLYLFSPVNTSTSVHRLGKLVSANKVRVRGASSEAPGWRSARLAKCQAGERG